MIPFTHPDSQTYSGLIKAALKSWLVSTLPFFVSMIPHRRRGCRSIFACGCTCPSPHLTNSTLLLQLSQICSRESFYRMLPMQALLCMHQIQIFVPHLFAIPRIPSHQPHHQNLFFHLIFSIIPSLLSFLSLLDCYLGRLLSVRLLIMR